MDCPHISICICTYKREGMLERLLRKIARQRTENRFTYSVVISDNDSGRSASGVAERVKAETGLDIEYFVQPIKNISLARNTGVLNAKGEFIAFIDDDEFPEENWLLRLFEICLEYKVAGVLGPVLPHFEVEPPAWVRAGRFYHRPRHTTGFELGWAECRTGNVLFRRSIVEGDPEPFHPEFGTGGEDQDFFRRMTETGHRFVWCDEAIAWETVPPERWDRDIMISRALLRGKNSLRQKKGRLKNLVKSAVAYPLYSVALPVLRVIGEHHYMRVLVRRADHAGRLLAILRMNPATERRG
jgi:succinoglycan biosynthesis protein ExoM